MPFPVPFVNLAADHADIRSELDAAARRVLDSSWFILGRELQQFEAVFAAYCQAPHCLGVGNGLDALHLILRGYGIGAGDEVIVPSHTFIATWLAVSQAGAQPVPVEPDPATGNIDATRLAAAITERTRAVIAVHLYGQPADMDGLRTAIFNRDIKLIEDAAQAHGARYKGRCVGSLGDAAAFSFYPTKNLGALGDGGAIVTHDDKLAAAIRRLRNYGSDKKYHHDVAGWNSRLDEIQAAFLSAKLAHLDRWNDNRRDAARTYIDGLTDLPELRLPLVPDWAQPVWHLFVVRCAQRDQLQAHLLNRGIETAIHYPVPPHLQGAYRDVAAANEPWSLACDWSRDALSLPMWPGVPAKTVVSAVREFFLGQTGAAP
jgi:dTDP-3-amino-3,4,6-trideoxy-alpha-D-glucose transaminase